MLINAFNYLSLSLLKVGSCCFKFIANLFFKLSVSTFYKQISKFQPKVQR